MDLFHREHLVLAFGSGLFSRFSDPCQSVPPLDLLPLLQSPHDATDVVIALASCRRSGLTALDPPDVSGRSLVPSSSHIWCVVGIKST